MSGWKHVFISKGEYGVDSGDDGPWLSFPLIDDETGEPVRFDYRGDALISYDGGRQYLGISSGPWDLNAKVLRVGEVTPQSVAQRAGWDYADKQKRKVWPKRAADDEWFKSGWMERWEQRRPRNNPSIVDSWWAR